MKKSSVFVGADWSMTCPALCVYDPSKTFKFENCQFYFLNGNKKFDKSFNNIHGFMMPLWDSEEERFDIISDWAMAVLSKYNVTMLCLEGYSMGSSKGRVFNIAENIGLFKHKLHKSEIPFITPAPTAVKKHFTGKGNANKDLMYEALLDKGLETDVEKLLNCKSKDSPVSDIVDSYAMVSYLLEHNLSQ